MSAVRVPKQRRSRESLERVLEAAHGLLEENGFEGFTVQEVAVRSGVSVGAIYERFGSKETILRAVHERLMEAMSRTTITADEAGSDAEAAVRDAVTGVADAMKSHRKALRAFMHLGAVDEVISTRGSQASIAQGKDFKRALMPYRERFAHRDPTVALDVAFRMTYSTLARQVMYGPVFESDRRIAWNRLVDELASACVAYLIGRGPGS